MNWIIASRGGFARSALLLSVSVLLVGITKADSADKKPALKSDKSAAIALYAKKDFEGARKLFAQTVEKNRGDAESYYYLGNCYVALRNLQAAIVEYQRASDIAGMGSIGVSSRQAISSLNNVLKPPTLPPLNPNTTTATKSPVSAVKMLDADGQPIKSDDDNKAAAKKSPKELAAEAEANEKIAAADKEAKKIMDEAENRCKPIKQDEDAAAQDMEANPRLSSTDAGTQMIKDTRAPYEEQIKNIMEPAKRRAQQIKDAAKAEADRIKQAAKGKR